MKLETLLEIKAENERFVKRLEDAIVCAESATYSTYDVIEGRSVYQTYECANCNQSGALKRSALDLKLVLTKITSPKC